MRDTACNDLKQLDRVILSTARIFARYSLRKVFQYRFRDTNVFELRSGRSSGTPEQTQEEYLQDLWLRHRYKAKLLVAVFTNYVIGLQSLI